MKYLEAKLTVVKKQRKIISLPIETLKVLKNRLLMLIQVQNLSLNFC